MRLKYLYFIKCASANWVSRLGVALTTSTFIVFLFMEILRFLSIITNAYVGLITYLIFPTLFAVGLLLVFIGWRILFKQSNKRDAELLAEKCSGDGLKEGVWRSKLMRTIGMLTLINILFLGAAGIRALNYMDTPSFCGTACHKVMNPEWVAYQASPHARVECVECHVGEGVGALIDSKINGAYQIISLAFSLYEKPIPTPVHNLRPARETCEKCHWPDKFLGSRLKTITHYDFDQMSTPKYTTLNLKIGSGQEGLDSGIHWHIAEKNQLRYLPFDEKRFKIIWVEVRQPDGGFKHFNNNRLLHRSGDEQLPVRVLDCIDCHNRATHIYENPEYAIDDVIDKGLLMHNIPFIKREGLAAITKNYPDKARGTKMIRIRLENFYRDNYPQFSGSNSARIDSIIEVLQAIYHRSIHPGMEIEWSSYPNHIGHRNSPGCFRCHNSNMVDETGKSISNECTLCHSILAFDSDEPFKHLLPLDEKESEYPMRKYLKEEFTKNYRTPAL